MLAKKILYMIEEGKQIIHNIVFQFHLFSDTCNNLETVLWGILLEHLLNKLSICLWKENAIMTVEVTILFLMWRLCLRIYVQRLSSSPLQEPHHHHLLPCARSPTKVMLQLNYNLRISQPKCDNVAAVVSDKRDKIFCSVLCCQIRAKCFRELKSP